MFVNSDLSSLSLLIGELKTHLMGFEPSRGGSVIDLISIFH